MPCAIVLLYKHVCIHSYKQAHIPYIHTYIQTDHLQFYGRVLQFCYVYMYAYIHTNKPTYIHTYTHTYIQITCHSNAVCYSLAMYTCMTHRHTYIHAYKQITCNFTAACYSLAMYMYVCMHTYKQTHIHTHIHTYSQTDHLQF